VKICDKRTTPASGVAALTSLERDSYADVRDHMIKISESNRSTLDTIDELVAVFIFDDGSPAVSSLNAGYEKKSFALTCFRARVWNRYKVLHFRPSKRSL